MFNSFKSLQFIEDKDACCSDSARLLKALKGNQGLPETMSLDEKEDLIERAHSALLLDWFATYRSFDGGKVLIGNDVACKVIGIGAIQIRMHDGIVRTLTDVRHVPELRKNLISLGTLDFNGYSYWAASKVMRIMKSALVVMKGLKQNSLYLLQGNTVTGAAIITSASSSDIDSEATKIWHICLGHMNEKGYGCAEQTRFLISRDMIFDESLILLKKEELIDIGKDHGVRERVELDVRASDSLPKISTDEEDGSHSTEEKEKPQEQRTTECQDSFSTCELEEEIFTCQPEGFVIHDKEDQVCLLKKSFYGLKKSPRQWYKQFNTFMAEKGYTRSAYDSSVYH
ncbi:hypothetical protein RJ639_019029 [Escallonia herrerae]|uniref:Polyprotein n=1 Tax=Escallonia herrerae TaxID=1293975 RepID=A0AA89AI37_9ASTE|nr:hypothetical protein RJ639_019029 [Escallonia herrerae]